MGPDVGQRIADGAPMKAIVVKSSQLEDRWDPGFHIIRKELEPRVAELEATIGAAEAYRRVMELPSAVKKPLLEIARGEFPRADEATYQRVAREYPLLSLALIEKHRARLTGKLRTEVAETESTILQLEELTAPTTETKA